MISYRKYGRFHVESFLQFPFLFRSTKQIHSRHAPHYDASMRGSCMKWLCVSMVVKLESVTPFTFIFLGIKMTRSCRAPHSRQYEHSCMKCFCANVVIKLKAPLKGGLRVDRGCGVDGGFHLPLVQDLHISGVPMCSLATS